MNHRSSYLCGWHIDAPPCPRRRPLWPQALGIALGSLLALGIVAGVARAEERFEPTSRGERSADLRPLFEEYSWPVDVAITVAWCESRLDPGAVNESSGATGLMQLMPDWGLFARRLFGRRVSFLDPAVNLRVAWALYVDSGERFGFHWAASRVCWGGSGW